MVQSKFFYVFTRPRRTRDLEKLHSAKQFHIMIESERVRVNRNQHEFSLIVFETAKPEADSNQVRSLAHILTNRKRSVDKAGWLDGHHIGVLLPYTSAVGAWKLADEIVSRMIAIQVLPPKCAVYTYPINWFYDNGGGKDQTHSKNFCTKQETTAEPDFSECTKHAESENIDFTAKRLTAGKLDWGQIVMGRWQDLYFPLPVWKRVMDITGALLGLVLLSPFLIPIVLGTRIVSPEPIFFKQKRVGFMGRLFTMWKFRTMKIDADTSVHQQYLAKLINGFTDKENSQKLMIKMEDDSRITLFGKIMRNTYLDELPQLLNVLRGEMSLVGPRPPIPYELEEYRCWHRKRIETVPGMTGLWQVSGKNRLTFDEMVRLDIRYWKEKSFWLDLKILLITPAVIFSQIKDSLRNKQLSTRGVVEND